MNIERNLSYGLRAQIEKLVDHKDPLVSSSQMLVDKDKKRGNQEDPTLKKQSKDSSKDEPREMEPESESKLGLVRRLDMVV